MEMAQEENLSMVKNSMMKIFKEDTLVQGFYLWQIEVEILTLLNFSLL